MNEIRITILALAAIFAAAAPGLAQLAGKADQDESCIVVSGAVRAPGRLKLFRQARLHEVIVAAGGLTERAEGTIKLIETGSKCYAEAWSSSKWPDHPLKVTEFSTAALTSGEKSADPIIHAGDVVEIVELDPIYVAGKVANPRALYSRKPPTVLEAINLAGGVPNETKNIKILVLRRDARGNYQEYLKSKLSELRKHPARAPRLRGMDIVSVGDLKIIRPQMFPTFDSRPIAPRPIF